MDKEIIKKIVGENIKNAKKGKFLKRKSLETALKYLETRHIISIVGVRRCGKSTLLKQLARHVLKTIPLSNLFYLNLEHPFFNQYKEDVNNLHTMYNFFEKETNKKYPTYVFLDEIQFFSDWQVFVKWLYENTKAKIIVTGSNSRLLSSELATILSGRTIPIKLYPFSFTESGLSISQYLTTGGFPEIIENTSIKKELAETYYKNIIYQDVIPRFKIQNTQAMENLSYYLLSNIGKEISYNTLKAITRLDDKTIKEYISYLEDANLLYLIHNYDHSLKKLIGNKKKIYVVDPIFTQISFKTSPDTGRIFENIVYLELKRKNKLFFHSNGGECDFLIKNGYSFSHAIQVCYTITKENKIREIKGLKETMKKFSIQKGYIITKNQKLKEEGIEIIPFNEFIKKFGMNSEN